MSASRTKTALLAVVLLYCGSMHSGAAAQDPQPAKLKPVAKRAQLTAQAQPSTQAQPAPQTGPLPPMTLAESPASPPKVSFGNGLLTIVAQNSTLGDILRAVRTQTGATMDIPPNATERVVIHLGPGPPRDVLAGLLNGSHFNYVIMGSATNPAAVEQVMLTPKSGEEPAPEVANTGRRRGPPPEQQEEVAADEPADDSANDADNQDQSQPEEQPAQQPNAPAAVKSPEELLKELQLQQQLQQQMQQQQQQGGAQPQNPPPQ